MERSAFVKNGSDIRPSIITRDALDPKHFERGCLKRPAMHVADDTGAWGSGQGVSENCGQSLKKVKKGLGSMEDKQHIADTHLRGLGRRRRDLLLHTEALQKLFAHDLIELVQAATLTWSTRTCTAL